jgi:Domain of unknown function (DUF4189)
MKTACCKVLLALTVLAGIGTMAWADFAAIAYSPQTGAWGSAYGHSYQSSAQNDALARCNASDGRVAVWVENGWAALARNADGTYGWGWSGNSRAEAESIALNNVGEGAYIVCWVFSGN